MKDKIIFLVALIPAISAGISCLICLLGAYLVHWGFSILAIGNAIAFMELSEMKALVSIEKDIKGFLKIF